MKNNFAKKLKSFFSPQGFWALFFSFFFGYFIVFWFAKIGIQSISNPQTNHLFITATIVFQIIILVLYLMNVYKNNDNLNKILKLSIIPFILFLIISLIKSESPYFQYFQNFALSFNLAFTVYLLLGNFIKNINKKKSIWIIWAIIILFAILYSLVAIIRHNHYGSFAYDLGLFSQVIYNYSTIGFGDSTIRGVANILGDHFSPILALLAPLYWIWANAKVLLIVQGIVLALVSWPLYLIIKEKLKNNLYAIIICLSYLLFAGIWQAVSFDFHEIVFFPVLFLSSFYFLERKKYLYYWIFFALALLVKEDVAIYFLAFSIYEIFFQKEYKVGIITLLISVGWYLGITGYVIPYFLQRSYVYFSFSSIGVNSIEALKNTITNPLFVYNQAVNDPIKIDTIFGLYGSFGYLPIFGPIYVFLSLPMLAEQVLFDGSTHWVIGFHYSVAIAPILILGSVYGAKKLSEIINHIFNSPPRSKISFTSEVEYKNKIIFFLCFLILFSSFIGSVNYRSAFINFFKKSFYEKEEWMKNIDQVIKDIPKDASIITQHNIVPHLSERRLIVPHPNERSGNRICDPDYYIFSITGYTFPSQGILDQISTIKDFLNNNKYGLYKQAGDAFVFKLGHQDPELENEATRYLEEFKKSP